MKIIYCLPAHQSYFPENQYTQKEIDQAISMFRRWFKPKKLKQIKEDFLFFTEPGKTLSPIFESNGIEKAAPQNVDPDTRSLAMAAQTNHVKRIKYLLDSIRRPKVKK